MLYVVSSITWPHTKGKSAIEIVNDLQSFTSYVVTVETNGGRESGGRVMLSLNLSFPELIAGVSSRRPHFG